MDFESYAHRSTRPLLRLAAALTGDPDLAQDIVQEVLVRAYRKWAWISMLPHPHAYVRRMVVNETVSWHRKWGRQLPLPGAELDRAEHDHTTQFGVRDELLAGISRLPARQRAAIVLRFFEDLSDGEIAEALGCRPVTVRGYVHRGLRALRVELDTNTLRETERAAGERNSHAY